MSYGEMEVQFHGFLTLAVDRSERSASSLKRDCPVPTAQAAGWARTPAGKLIYSMRIVGK